MQKLAVETLEEGFIVTAVDENQQMVRTACLCVQSAYAKIGEIMGVAMGTTTVSVPLPPVEPEDTGKPRTPVDNDNRDAAIKWLAERGVDVKKGQKNTTVTKLVEETPVEIPTAPSTPEEKAEAPEEKTVVEEKAEAPEEKTVVEGDCPLCGGSGVFLEGTPAESKCVMCDGTGNAGDIELSAPAIRTQFNVVLDAAPDVETRKKWVDEGVLKGQAKAGITSLTKLPPDVPLETVLECMVEAVRSAMTGPAEVEEEDEWA